MTDRAQFEAMLEALINDDQETAKDIFHTIVVAKSREIYEELLESDFSESEDVGNPYAAKEEGYEEEEDDAEESEEDEEDEEDKIEKDIDQAEDDAEDIEADAEEADHDSEEGDDEAAEHEEGEIEDRVMDLEDALEDLKAEFEQLMAGEESEPEHADMFGGEEEPADMGGEHDELAGLMEYVIPVRDGHGAERKGVSSKTVGSGSYENAGENNTRSVVAGKNDMGGTSANIANAGVEVHGDAGVKAGGTTGGLAKNTPQDIKSGNINVPGGKAGKTAYKTRVADGHGAEKKGVKPGKNAGADTGAHANPGESNTTSILRPLKK
jgi:hypothetical protein